MSTYEKHNYRDTELPMYLHIDGLQEKARFPAHWHEPLELLLFTEGECSVSGNGISNRAKPGDLVFFNSNCIHNLIAGPGGCKYYCLTVDVDAFGERLLSELGDQPMAITRDERIVGLYRELLQLKQETPYLYKREMKAVLQQMIIRLCRLLNDTPTEPYRLTKQCRMVMQGIVYMQSHFTEPITVDEISDQVGYNKYYFSHQFKEIMGQSVVDYLNFLRCKNARRLMADGEHNISESALLSGFKNLSYFSKVYKKQMGVLPSKQ